MVLEGTKSKAIVRATQWKSMASYKFIFDNDSRKTAEFFPRRRIVSLEQAGLTEKASDREIVEVASDRKWIIVTANGDHFIAEIKRYLRQSMKLVCHDLSGLVIVPNDYQLQQRILPRIGQRLNFDGKHIDWKDVWELDCCVRVTKDGKAQVTRFERCFYCKKRGVA
jgi:predicted nuclease of predicted toxin-antitoxin system